jgi:hypothetical protein
MPSNYYQSSRPMTVTNPLGPLIFEVNAVDSCILTNEEACAAGETTVEARRDHLLPSGRSVVLKLAGNQEELEVRSPGGNVEVRILLTDQGAVVTLQGGRLEMASPDTVALICRRVEINSTEGTDLLSSGDVRITGREMRVQTESDIHMNGRIIHLNC